MLETQKIIFCTAMLDTTMLYSVSNIFSMHEKTDEIYAALSSWYSFGFFLFHDFYNAFSFFFFLDLKEKLQNVDIFIQTHTN
jgi:hypothetical protein